MARLLVEGFPKLYLTIQDADARIGLHVEYNFINAFLRQKSDNEDWRQSPSKTDCKVLSQIHSAGCEIVQYETKQSVAVHNSPQNLQKIQSQISSVCLWPLLL